MPDVNAGRFVGKVVVVTGGGSGIGRETAVRFGREGASVVVADVDQVGGEQTVRLIHDAGSAATLAHVDVSEPEAVSVMVDTAADVFGRLDVLHNNAYWAPLNRPLLDTSLDEWERTLAVTLTGVFLGCKYAIPAMLAGGGGAIVNTASIAALVAAPRFAAYAAAKGGVVALTRSIAHDYGGHGIRCNAVCPGLIDTPATAPLLASEERRTRLAQALPVGRVGQPADIAAAVLFLASEESSFMTGQTMVVDGGAVIV